MAVAFIEAADTPVAFPINTCHYQNLVVGIILISLKVTRPIWTSEFTNIYG